MFILTMYFCLSGALSCEFKDISADDVGRPFAELSACEALGEFLLENGSTVSGNPYIDYRCRTYG